MQIPLNIVTEEFKVTRTREELQYRDSNDLVAMERSGIGSFLTPQYNNAKCKERQLLIQDSSGRGKNTQDGCSVRGMLKHILSSSPKVLGDHFYCWHHNQVLKAVAESVSSVITSSIPYCPRKQINFIKAGEQQKQQPRATFHRIGLAVVVDSVKQKFPKAHIAVTS